MSIYLVVAVLAVVVLCVSSLLKKSNPSDSDFTYSKVEALFSSAERSFYGVLKQAVEGKAEVFAKVRVADVLMPAKGQGRSGWQKAFNKVSRKHFDFLVCNSSDLSVLCAVELDDKSHQKKSRQERDVFLTSACESANVPLVNVKAQASYSVAEVKGSISSYVPGLVEENASVEQSPEGRNVCPKCSTTLVKRIAKKGTHAGKVFMACSAYPKCRYVEPVNV